MKRAAILGVLCLSLSFAQAPTVAAPDLKLDATNLSDVLRTLATYIQSRQYEREIRDVANAAHDWVEARKAKPGERLAAVFDIDETLLWNVPNILDCGFCSSSLQSRLYGSKPLPAIPPMKALYEFTKSKGVTPILLTGRQESSRAATAAGLDAAGITGYGELLFRPNGNAEPARTMKAGVRKGVEAKGYKIILSIGDQLSDLSGGFAERTYKLPNPFYFVE